MFQVGRQARAGMCYADTPFLSNRSDLASSSACKEYKTSTKCLLTLEKSCPGQRPGKNGAFDSDGSTDYKCCCTEGLWQSMCSSYMAKDGCAWTKEKACPGQAKGSGGFASDDGSEKYKCCCTMGLWQEPAELWKTWVSGGEVASCPASAGRETQIFETGMFDVYGMMPVA